MMLRIVSMEGMMTHYTRRRHLFLISPSPYYFYRIYRLRHNIFTSFFFDELPRPRLLILPLGTNRYTNEYEFL